MAQFVKRKLFLIAGFIFLILTVVMSYYIGYTNGVSLTPNNTVDQTARTYLENHYKGYVCESLSFAQKDRVAYARIMCEKNHDNNGSFSDIAKLTLNNKGEIIDLFIPNESNYKESINSHFPQVVRDEYHRSWTMQITTLNDRIKQREP